MTQVYSVYGLECIYCGEPATDRDHVIPHSLQHDRDARREYSESEVVPACRDCNGSLSAKPIVTIAERANWIAVRLEKKLVKMPVWDEEEMSSLGPTLRRVVKAGQVKRLQTECRLAHARQVANLHGLTPIRYWETGGKNMYLN